MRSVTRPFAVLVLALSTLCSPGSAAESASAWRGVTRVRGTYTITNESWNRDEPRSSSYQKETATMNFVLAWEENAIPAAAPGIPPEMVELLVRSGQISATDAAKLTAETAKIAPGPPALRFRGERAQITGTFRSESSLKEFSRDKGWTVVSSNLNEATFSGEPRDVGKDFDFMIYPGKGEWSISLPKELREEYTVRHSSYNRDGGARNSESRKRSVLDHPFRGTVSGPLAPITASYSREDINKSDPKRGSRKIAQLELWPEASDVALELTIPGYEAWRPRATVDIKRLFEPGNHLVVRATLVPKGGRVEDLPGIASLKFALADTSREPGICLNWPLDMEDDALFDLKLDEVPASPGFLDEHGQTNEVKKTAKDATGRPYGESRLNSFDFGGRATLSVTCVLTDGRQLIGTLKTAEGEEGRVRLPYMKKAGWIADSWRRQHNVAGLPEDHDEESVDGQKYKGDGYTLYEEYRGWVVNGRHVEGDPKQKDFFVLNLIGADAALGIELFEQASQLRVHAKLKPTEMSEEKRQMNGNRRDAPQRVKQHGVWVKTYTSAALGVSGATTVMTKAGVAGRPNLVKGIGILARHDSESEFNKPGNLPAEQAALAYDRAIAHELLHSVGVEHHGSGDGTQMIHYVSTRNPFNKAGRPYYSRSLDGPPLTLLTEEGEDVAVRFEPEYVRSRKQMDDLFWEKELKAGAKFVAERGPNHPYAATAEAYANKNQEMFVWTNLNLEGTVGVPQGEHSGNETCLMRYHFAKFYEANGRKDTFYLITPGTERLGLSLCRSGAGTGANAASHRPQSRHGNAAAGEGNCFSQICPNDAVEPRSVK